MFEIAFWMPVALIAYAYAGYPLALGVVSLLWTRRVEKADVTPPATFIIAAYNEEKRIAEKLENTLNLVYCGRLAALFDKVTARSGGSL